MEKKKGFLKKLLAVMIAVFSLTLLSPEMATQLGTMQTVQAAVKISSKSMVLVKGQKKTLKLKGTSKKAKWSTNKKAVATVSSKGVVTAKKKGTAVITAKVGSKKYTCKVTVETPKLNKSSVSLDVNKSITLKMNGTKQAVKWSSDDKEIATVNSRGKVTAKEAGIAKITANVGGAKYVCRVKVKVQAMPTPVTEIKYGQVTGNITYHYNQYRGYVADTGARVYLIPTDGSAKNVSEHMNFRYNMDGLRDNNIYAAKVDGMGSYTINRVPEGNYIAVIISDNSSGQEWFDAYDDSIHDAPDSFYERIAKAFRPYLSKISARDLADSITYNNYIYETFTVYSDSENTLSYAFPYTYI